ncbi:MAG: energy-coupling factor ABC transporter permease [Oligoflexales bacterium]|nr:energy-coupling factor ABC transporter permease [Oligoflexales bacterium]
MHLSEGILPVKPAVITFSLVLPLVIDSYKKYSSLNNSIKREDKKPFLTLAFALCFAVTLLPIPVPIAGATSHMCATPLLALVLGPRLLVLPTLCVLLLQALFFAHGGLTTLGANVLTLGVIGPWMTYLVFYALKKLRLDGSLLIGLSCFIGSISVYMADSILLGWALSDKQHFLETVKIVTLGFLPVQGPLSLLEGVLSASILAYLAKYRDDFVPANILGAFKFKVPQLGASTMLFLLFAFTCSMNAAFAEGFGAIDDTVFAKVAEDLNSGGWDLFPWIEGEVELFFFSLGFFISGLLVGKSLERLRGVRVGKEVKHA